MPRVIRSCLENFSRHKMHAAAVPSQRLLASSNRNHEQNTASITEEEHILKSQRANFIVPAYQ